MNEQMTDFSFYCNFRKCPNFYGNWVRIFHLPKGVILAPISLAVMNRLFIVRTLNMQMSERDIVRYMAIKCTFGDRLRHGTIED